MSPLRGVRVRGLLLFVGRVLGGLHKTPARFRSLGVGSVPAPVSCILGSWRLPGMRACGLGFSSPTLKSQQTLCEKRRLPGQFDMEASQGRTISNPRLWNSRLMPFENATGIRVGARTSKGGLGNAA